MCGAISCFNAFSRVDVRVEVKIPGGVDGELATFRPAGSASSSSTRASLTDP